MLDVIAVGLRLIHRFAEQMYGGRAGRRITSELIRLRCRYLVGAQLAGCRKCAPGSPARLNLIRASRLRRLRSALSRLRESIISCPVGPPPQLTLLETLQLARTGKVFGVVCSKVAMPCQGHALFHVEQVSTPVPSVALECGAREIAESEAPLDRDRDPRRICRLPIPFWRYISGLAVL
jgi:hypothetical protein